VVWRPMDHVNLLRFHQHNYRKGHGIVGDWKNSLVNEHLDVLREFGFDQHMEALSYPPVGTLEPRSYSPYQKLIAQYLRRGETYRNVGDQDLFGFAFNKSNIDASKFGFKTFPQRKWTRVERSSLTRDDVVLAVSDTAEECCEKVNAIFEQVLSRGAEGPAEARRALELAKKEWIGLMGEVADPRGIALCAGGPTVVTGESVR
jgi:hypothetical protein